MKLALQTERLAVGYHGKALIRDIDIELEQGRILTLIGPNGAGKSTILKSMTGQLPILDGRVSYEGRELSAWIPKELAKHIAVVLTDRIRPELMTCAEVVAMGRYPYTNMFGRLTPKDKEIVEDALRRVHGIELANQDFSTLSDGQRQRIMLARAICQEPKVLILDEPTAYLDIRHKIELLDILQEMVQNHHMTVVMSLHEIDLALKISDDLLCVRPGSNPVFGKPEAMRDSATIELLYDMVPGSYDRWFGKVR